MMALRRRDCVRVRASGGRCQLDAVHRHGTPIRPVEQTKISRGFSQRCPAARRAISRVSAIPCAPVQALRCPIEKNGAGFSRAQISIETRTGAAFTTFVVKVPAAVQGNSETTMAVSSRFGVRFCMPEDPLPQIKPLAHKGRP